MEIIWRGGVLLTYLKERGSRRRMRRFALKNSLLLAGCYSNPPPPPPHCYSSRQPQRSKWGKEEEGERDRVREREWRTPFLELMFSFPFPLVWLIFLKSRMIQHYLCLHGCMPAMLPCSAFLLLTFDILICLIIDNIFPLNLWRLVLFPLSSLLLGALFIAFNLV